MCLYLSSQSVLQGSVVPPGRGRFSHLCSETTKWSLLRTHTAFRRRSPADKHTQMTWKWLLSAIKVFKDRKPGKTPKQKRHLDTCGCTPARGPTDPTQTALSAPRWEYWRNIWRQDYTGFPRTEPETRRDSLHREPVTLPQSRTFLCYYTAEAFY